MREKTEGGEVEEVRGGVSGKERGELWKREERKGREEKGGEEGTVQERSVGRGPVAMPGPSPVWPAALHLGLALQRGHIERQEEAVEQVVGEHVAEELAVDDEDVVEIMQVVQVLRHQVTQLAPVPVPELGEYPQPQVSTAPQDQIPRVGPSDHSYGHQTKRGWADLPEAPH